MPHQCTNCDRQFADGSKEMLSGCPGCGGNKFQFLPSSALEDAPTGPNDAGSPGDEAGGELQFGHATERTDDPGTTVQDAPADEGPAPTGGDEDTDGSIIDADARAPEFPEDTAQADARSTVISDDELRAASDPVPDDEEEPEDEPDLSALREELNEQFESIKILEPGQYELNLMELYDREEYIVALQEDGRYAIEVPDSWREGEE